MASSLAKKGRQLAIKVLIFQALIMSIVAIISYIWLGKEVAKSALIGGLICLIPCMIFARHAFRFAGGSQNRLVVRSFNVGAKLKLLATVLLFVVAFTSLNALPGPLFVGFVITTAAQWVAMFSLRHNS